MNEQFRRRGPLLKPPLAARGPAAGNASARARFLILLFVLYYVPPTLMLAGVIPFTWRFGVLAMMTALTAAYDYLRGVGLRELGFRKDNLKDSLALNVAASLLLILLLFVSFKSGLIREPTVPRWALFFAYYIFISSPSQEFLFRGNLFALMSRSGIERPLVRVVTSAATFSFMHVIYKDPLTLAAAFSAGLLWGWMYQRLPNFWGVAFSHALVGAAAILFGLV